MPRTHHPRHGSMQVWPRKRAARHFARVRTWNNDAAGPAGFPGYKAGMTHVLVTDQRKNSITKNESISFPVTVIECPPLKIAGVRFYKNVEGIRTPSLDIHFKTDKFVTKVTPLKQRGDLEKVDLSGYVDMTLIAYTQPVLAGIKKKPELFELSLGGSIQDKVAFAKDRKEISPKDVLKEGSLVDVRAVTKGKGFQGPVKRFGVAIRSHKAEKTKRGPATLGGWSGHAHFMYRVAHAGQMGFHQRTQYNNQIIKIGDKPEDVNPSGGFIRYGNVKNSYVLLRGSVPGAKKRLIFLTTPIRRTTTNAQFVVESISTTSKQR